ncbi:MAG: flagellar assembly protein FliH [Hahellaceae bacterium]|nr:flagellar assembly protein FliH [Hahellaceae bacterium]
MKRTPERIPVEQLTAYERWELPLLDEQGNETQRTPPKAVEVEEEVKPLTAAELEDIRLAAWNEGLEDGRKEGLAKGHSEGLEQGHAEGKAKGLVEGKAEGMRLGAEHAQQQRQQEIDELLQRVSGVLEELLEPIRLHEDEIEEAVLNLVLAISRAVTRRELQIDSRQIAGVVREAFQLLPETKDNVRIHINPVDEVWVSPLLAKLEANASLSMNDAILAGGCKVETQHSLIDFTVEKRFQKVVQQMLDRHISNTPTDETPDLADAMGEMTDFHTELLDVKFDSPSEKHLRHDSEDMADLSAETLSSIESDAGETAASETVDLHQQNTDATGSEEDESPFAS